MIKSDEEKDEKKLEQKDALGGEKKWLEKMHSVIFPEKKSLAEQINETVDENFCLNEKVKVLLSKEGKFKEQRKRKLKLENQLKNLSENIPCVYFGSHSQHTTQVIEKLIPYLCIAAYGAQPSDVIKNICRQSETVKKPLLTSYRTKLMQEERRDLARLFIQETLKLDSLIQELPQQGNRTPEQFYKDYIGDNSSKNMKDHKQKFSQWFIKAQYLSDPSFIIDPAPVTVLKEVVANKNIVSQNLSQWYGN